MVLIVYVKHPELPYCWNVLDLLYHIQSVSLNLFLFYKYSFIVCSLFKKDLDNLILFLCQVKIQTLVTQAQCETNHKHEDSEVFVDSFTTVDFSKWSAHTYVCVLHALMRRVFPEI